MTTYEMQPSGSHTGKSEDTQEQISGFYKCVLGLGAAQLFCGIAFLALGIANAIVCGMLGSIGYGIWGSVICFVAGAVAIMAYVKQTRCMLGAHLVLAIVTAATAAVQLGMGAGSAAADYAALKASDTSGSLDAAVWNVHSGLDYFFVFGCSDHQRGSYWTWQASGPTVTDALLASFACISGIISILGAIYSCRICICPPGVRLIAGHVTHTSQMTIVSKA